MPPGPVESGSTAFPIPHLGANWELSDGSNVGVAVYGNGGMNTDYASPTFGFAPAGVDLAQIFVAPTYARKLGSNHSLGVSAILAYQRFRAQGLSAFAPFSAAPGNLSDNDHDNSFGAGVRIGYLGEWSPAFSVGASYQSTIRMSEFDHYAGLFAEQGGFDIPANWVVGIAVKPFDDLALVFDVQQVLYGGIASVANPLLPNLGQAPLGADAGAGFGWEDMTTFKTGIQWRSSDNWTWRGGFSFGDQPIRGSEMLFNIVAPGVIEKHATFGLSRSLGDGKELNTMIMRAFSKSIDGPNGLEAPGQQQIELKMNQWEFELSYAFGF